MEVRKHIWKGHRVEEAGMEPRVPEKNKWTSRAKMGYIEFESWCGDNREYYYPDKTWRKRYIDAEEKKRKQRDKLNTVSE